MRRVETKDRVIRRDREIQIVFHAVRRYPAAENARILVGIYLANRAFRGVAPVKPIGPNRETRRRRGGMRCCCLSGEQQNATGRQHHPEQGAR